MYRVKESDTPRRIACIVSDVIDGLETGEKLVLAAYVHGRHLKVDLNRVDRWPDVKVAMEVAATATAAEAAGKRNRQQPARMDMKPPTPKKRPKKRKKVATHHTEPTSATPTAPMAVDPAVSAVTQPPTAHLAPTAGPEGEPIVVESSPRLLAPITSPAEVLSTVPQPLLPAPPETVGDQVGSVVTLPPVPPPASSNSASQVGSVALLAPVPSPASSNTPSQVGSLALLAPVPPSASSNTASQVGSMVVLPPVPPSPSTTAPEVESTVVHSPSPLPAPTSPVEVVTVPQPPLPTPSSVSSGFYYPFDVMESLEELIMAMAQAQDQELPRLGVVLGTGLAFMSSMKGLCLPLIEPGLKYTPPVSDFVVAYKSLRLGSGLESCRLGFREALTSVVGTSPLLPGSLVEFEPQREDGTSKPTMYAYVCSLAFPFSGLSHDSMPVVTEPEWQNRIWIAIAEYVASDRRLGDVRVASLMDMTRRHPDQPPYWVHDAIKQSHDSVREAVVRRYREVPAPMAVKAAASGGGGAATSGGRTMSSSSASSSGGFGGRALGGGMMSSSSADGGMRALHGVGEKSSSVKPSGRDVVVVDGTYVEGGGAAPS